MLHTIVKDPATPFYATLSHILSADVLVEIMDNVPEAEISQFLLVGSRLLYHHAILKLLRHVNIRSSRSLEGFLRVLTGPLSLGRSRYCAVRAIDFNVLGSIHSRAGNRLAKAVSQMENLRKVCFSYAEDLLYALPGLSYALANLVSIRSLSASDVGVRFLAWSRK